jgi:exosome complex RNA-binding protein Rrp42 (RNase PH superfamily)
MKVYYNLSIKTIDIFKIILPQEYMNRYLINNIRIDGRKIDENR